MNPEGQKQPPEVFLNERCSEKLCKFQRKTSTPESLFENVAGSRKACNFIKKKLQHRCFPLKFAKFFENTYFEKHLWTTASRNDSFSNLEKLEVYLEPCQTCENSLHYFCKGFSMSKIWDNIEEIFQFSYERATKINFFLVIISKDFRKVEMSIFVFLRNHVVIMLRMIGHMWRLRRMYNVTIRSFPEIETCLRHSSSVNVGQVFAESEISS